jgi:hypothetical protein
LEGPEVHHSHGRHGGGLPQWLELTIAGTALVTSVCSIIIAIHHGHTMEKLVEANSIPYLVGGFSTATTTGDQVLSLDFLNRGVGPAHERSLRVKVDGQYVTSMDELIVKSLPPEHATEVRKARKDGILQILKNNVHTRFVPGSGEQLVFRIPRTGERRGQMGHRVLLLLGVRRLLGSARRVERADAHRRVHARRASRVHTELIEPPGDRRQTLGSDPVDAPTRF